METYQIKKALQKAIKTVRDTEFPGEPYPKAMMTGAQEAKRTATVNCGWRKDMAKAVLQHKAFTEFVEKTGVRVVGIEPSVDRGWQVRIRY